MEVALLIGLRAVKDPLPLDGNYRDLLEFIVQISGRSSYRDLIARDRRGLLLYAGTYTALRACGIVDSRFEHVLKQAVNGRMATVIERIPYRMLDLFHTLGAANLLVDADDFARAAQMTLLAGNPNVVDLNDSDAYAITHAVYYLTDFASRSLNDVSPIAANQSVELLETLGMFSRRRGNADLVGEVAAALASLGASASPEVSQCLTYLAAKQAPDGAIAGPPDALRADMLGDDPEYREWALAYHTTAVAALAALLLRTRHRRPEAETRVASASAPTSLVAETVARAARFLLSADDRSLEERLDAFAACCQVLDADDERLVLRGKDLTREVEARSDAAELWGAMGADVVWILAQHFHAVGSMPPSLRTFLDEVSRFIETTEEPPDGTLAAARTLKSLGLLSDGAVHRLTGGRVHPPAGGEEFDPRALAASIIVRSGGDTAAIAGPPSSWVEAGEAMAEALTSAFREYDLAGASALIRGLTTIGWGTRRVTRDAMELLCRQQDIDGAFGFAAIDDSEISADSRFRWTLAAIAALADEGVLGPDG